MWKGFVVEWERERYEKALHRLHRTINIWWSEILTTLSSSCRNGKCLTEETTTASNRLMLDTQNYSSQENCRKNTDYIRCNPLLHPETDFLLVRMPECQDALKQDNCISCSLGTKGLTSGVTAFYASVALLSVDISNDSSTSEILYQPTFTLPHFGLWLFVKPSVFVHCILYVALK